jgi:hypothetical protein
MNPYPLYVQYIAVYIKVFALYIHYTRMFSKILNVNEIPGCGIAWSTPTLLVLCLRHFPIKIIDTAKAQILLKKIFTTNSILAIE